LDDARDCYEKICHIHTTTLSPDKAQKLQYLDTLLLLIPLRIMMKKYDVAHQEGKIVTQLVNELYPDRTTQGPSSMDSSTTTTMPGNEANDDLETLDFFRANAFGVVGMTLIWNETCDHEKAQEYLFQSFRARQYYYGTIHTSNAFICHLLAIVYRKLNRFHPALHYHHMAIRMYEILLGEKNVVTTSCVGELGITIQTRASFQVGPSYPASHLSLSLLISFLSSDGSL
jgi:hypothetical protein